MLNRIVLIGRLTRDPELRYTQNGVAVASFTLAVDRNYKNANGEKETGVTTMYMEKGLDTGDIIFTETTPIYDTDNAGTLHDRLAKMGGRLILKTIDALKNGTAPRTKQQDPSSYAPMIDNTLRKINFSDSAENIVNLIRGLSPYPSAFAKFEEKNIRLH